MSGTEERDDPSLYPMFEEGHYTTGSCYHEVSSTPYRGYDMNDENVKAAHQITSDIANTLTVPDLYHLPPILTEIQRKMKDVWTKQRSRYLQFWSSMNIEARVDYIMEVSPFLCYADNDRHFIRNGKRIYERITRDGAIDTYDAYMVLVPYMNAKTLASDAVDSHNLIWLFDQLCSWDLAAETTNLIYNFRLVYESKKDLTGKDYFTKVINTLFLLTPIT